MLYVSEAKSVWHVCGCEHVDPKKHVSHVAMHVAQLVMIMKYVYHLVCVCMCECKCTTLLYE